MEAGQADSVPRFQSDGVGVDVADAVARGSAAAAVDDDKGSRGSYLGAGHLGVVELVIADGDRGAKAVAVEEG